MAGWGNRRGKPLAMPGSKAGRITLILLLAASSYGGGGAAATASAGMDRGNYMSSSGTHGKRITGFAGWWRCLKQQLMTPRSSEEPSATGESGRRTRSRSRVGPLSTATASGVPFGPMDTDIQEKLCKRTNLDV